MTSHGARVDGDGSDWRSNRWARHFGREAQIFREMTSHGAQVDGGGSDWWSNRWVRHFGWVAKTFREMTSHDARVDGDGSDWRSNRWVRHFGRVAQTFRLMAFNRKSEQVVPRGRFGGVDDKEALNDELLNVRYLRWWQYRRFVFQQRKNTQIPAAQKSKCHGYVTISF
ncbi:hypothetical protein OsI_32670 [Oryza sativa Indica Group]|uniref:Uncharacterized protein n=1 Tax=Oryza sativa subsp. indica TaxID=39946 RepID=B8BFM4_ORYSI|nr:hypothetical protein OsI_32670 [Oryza sativa Indica Group]